MNRRVTKVKPSRATTNPVDGKACSSKPWWFTTLYTLHLLDSQRFEFKICIFLAFQMPLIRCNNLFYQGRLSRHIASPSEKTRPESRPRNYMGKATPVFPPLPPNVTKAKPSRTTANPVDGKACSSTKDGLFYTYSIHKVSSLKFAYY